MLLLGIVVTHQKKNKKNTGPDHFNTQSDPSLNVHSMICTGSYIMECSRLSTTTMYHTDFTYFVTTTVGADGVHQRSAAGAVLAFRAFTPRLAVCAVASIAPVAPVSTARTIAATAAVTATGPVVSVVPPCPVRLLQRHRETPRDTERKRETPRDTERKRETPRDTERHRETPRKTRILVCVKYFVKYL